MTGNEILRLFLCRANSVASLCLQHDTKVMRKYYIGIKRNDEVIYVRDSVLLKSGPRRKDLPFVARVSGFWEENDGRRTVTLSDCVRLLVRKTIIICCSTLIRK